LNRFLGGGRGTYLFLSSDEISLESESMMSGMEQPVGLGGGDAGGDGDNGVGDRGGESSGSHDGDVGEFCIAPGEYGVQFGDVALSTYGLSGLYPVDDILSSWRGWSEWFSILCKKKSISSSLYEFSSDEFT
jgi:hypothetical protein